MKINLDCQLLWLPWLDRHPHYKSTSLSVSVWVMELWFWGLCLFPDSLFFSSFPSSAKWLSRADQHSSCMSIRHNVFDFHGPRPLRLLAKINLCFVNLVDVRYFVAAIQSWLIQFINGWIIFRIRQEF